MIQRVYEQAKKASRLEEVYVATDDSRILNAVKEFGGNAIMTSPEHPSGTDRCNEVAQSLSVAGRVVDVVINIQGDEPFIRPEQIDLLCSCFDNPGTRIATLAKKINSPEDLFSTSVNKVIISLNNQAVYFSRTPIPFLQNVDIENWIVEHTYYKHIGIYGYRADILEAITRLKPTLLEKAESLEQLRWLDHGFPITVEKTEYESISIDTPEDLSKITNMA